jgi:hypothetical protein
MLSAVMLNVVILSVVHAKCSFHWESLCSVIICWASKCRVLLCCVDVVILRVFKPSVVAQRSVVMLSVLNCVLLCCVNAIMVCECCYGVWVCVRFVLMEVFYVVSVLLCWVLHLSVVMLSFVILNQIMLSVLSHNELSSFRTPLFNTQILD